jgi:high-affinity Fe2+/Pb2+ permease
VKFSKSATGELGQQTQSAEWLQRLPPRLQRWPRVFLNQAGRSQWIIYVMLLGVVTVVIVVVARREAPLRIRKTKTTMDKAAEAVKAVQNADIFGSSIVLYQKCFEAWLAVTTSAETREKQKRRLDAVAVLMLAVETSVAAFGMVS